MITKKICLIFLFFLFYKTNSFIFAQSDIITKEYNSPKKHTTVNKGIDKKAKKKNNKKPKTITNPQRNKPKESKGNNNSQVVKSKKNMPENPKNNKGNTERVASADKLQPKGVVDFNKTTNKPNKDDDIEKVKQENKRLLSENNDIIRQRDKTLIFNDKEYPYQATIIKLFYDKKTLPIINENEKYLMKRLIKLIKKYDSPKMCITLSHDGAENNRQTKADYLRNYIIQNFDIPENRIKVELKTGTPFASFSIIKK